MVYPSPPGIAYTTSKEGSKKCNPLSGTLSAREHAAPNPKVFSEALASYVRLFTEVLDRLSEKPHERANLFTIRRLIATM